MNFALIFAGGVGQRMNSVSLPKQFLLVHGKPIIVHTIEHFQNCSQIDQIVVVCVSNYIERMHHICSQYQLTKVVKIVEGGPCGQDSIFNGLSAINSISNCRDDIVLIHDGVRPIIDDDTISQNIKIVKEKGNCITVASAIETVMTIEDGNVKTVVDRSKCFLGRAPQSFFVKDIFECHLKARKLGKHDFIDSAMLMKYFGYQLFTVLGPSNNIKVTTPMDYFLFKAILDAKENEQIKVL